MKKALKVEIEGTDGAGKTTALKYLIEQLKLKNKKVLETREVGSPLVPINIKLRELVLSPESNLSGEAMELIFSAMRFENDKLYNKVSAEYDFIVSDRGWLSHLAYTDHNVSKEFTEDFYINFMQKYTSLPDVVIYFSVNSETALKRRVKRGEAADAIEVKGIAFQELVRESFNKYINRSNIKTFVVDANQSIESVQSQINEIVNSLALIKKAKEFTNG